MSQENVEIVRRWIDDYNSRDTESLFAITDPDFEFRSYFVAIESIVRGAETFTNRAVALDAVGLSEPDAHADSS